MYKRQVKDFVKSVSERAVGRDVLESLTPVSYTHLDVYKRQGENASQRQLLKTLRTGTYIAAALAAIAAIPLTYYSMNGVATLGIGWAGVLVSIFAGLIAGCLIGYFTEYYTSDTYKPTQELAATSETGAATVTVSYTHLDVYKRQHRTHAGVRDALYRTFRHNGRHSVRHTPAKTCNAPFGTPGRL